MGNRIAAITVIAMINTKVTAQGQFSAAGVTTITLRGLHFLEEADHRHITNVPHAAATLIACTTNYDGSCET